jgi:hypothetical protein
MHGNVWATLYGTLVPSVLIFLIAGALWLKRKKTAIVATIGGMLFLFLPASFLISHLSDKKREMKKREGIYSVYRQHNLEELCPDGKADSLLLTLKRNGEYSFNFKPCFADRQTGKWIWTDDMVGTYAKFEINIRNSAYFDFNEGDTLRLVNGNKTYLTFARKPLTK